MFLCMRLRLIQKHYTNIHLSIPIVFLMSLRLYQNTDLHSTYREICQYQRGCSTASLISLPPTYSSLVPVAFVRYVCDSSHKYWPILTTKNMSTVLSRMFDCVSHLSSTCTDSFSAQCIMRCVLHTHSIIHMHLTTVIHDRWNSDHFVSTFHMRV